MMRSDTRPVYQSLQRMRSDHERWVGAAFLKNYLTGRYAFHDRSFGQLREMPGAYAFIEDVGRFMGALRGDLTSNDYLSEELNSLEHEAVDGLTAFHIDHEDVRSWRSVEGVLIGLIRRLYMERPRWEWSTMYEAGGRIIQGIDEGRKKYKGLAGTLGFSIDPVTRVQPSALDDPVVEFYAILDGLRALGSAAKARDFLHPQLRR